MDKGSGQILVFSEDAGLLKELLKKARQAADGLGWQVAALPWNGSGPEELAAAGADVVFQASAVDTNSEVAAAVLAETVKQGQPNLVLVGATKLGMEIAPRVAERTGAGYAAWTVGFEIDPADCAVTARCMLYTGLGQATYHFNPQTVLLSAATGALAGAPEPGAGRTAQVVLAPAASTPARVRVVAEKPKPATGSRLEEAKLVLDVGQGIKAREDLEMVNRLAEMLNGQLACSRPIASDRDWFPEWLGLSGKKVRPDLCLALGISGAIQHMVGIRDAHLIAAVNNDENAGIFLQSDYGVVADLYDFLPVLIERLQARGIRPTWN